MIRTLVVDDDYRVADLHRAYVERVPGFSVVGEARTGKEALEMIDRLRPDLVLLDIYLPDLSGLEVIRTVRDAGSTQVEVIAVTAARDVETLRAAMHGGVVHYLIKPFRFAALEEKLLSYAELHRRLRNVSLADQREVDRLYDAMRRGSAESLPKGLSRPTLEIVSGVVQQATRDLTAAEVAELARLSRVTARRYLDHLCQAGRLELVMRYGSPGRPEHRYRTPQGASRAPGLAATLSAEG
jgi:two-component system CitB family response regulator